MGRGEEQQSELSLPLVELLKKEGAEDKSRAFLRRGVFDQELNQQAKQAYLFRHPPLLSI